VWHNFSQPSAEVISFPGHALQRLNLDELMVVGLTKVGLLQIGLMLVELRSEVGLLQVELTKAGLYPVQLPLVCE
jgi:hypothetical protein